MAGGSVVQIEPLSRAALSTIIRNGTTTSAVIDMEGLGIVGFEIPLGWDGGTTLSFQAAESLGGTYQAVYDAAGNQITVTIAASRCVVLSSVVVAALQYLRFIKIVAAQATSGDRTILVLRKQGG